MNANQLSKTKKNISDLEKWRLNPGTCVKCGDKYAMPGIKMCSDCCGDWDCDNCNAHSSHWGIEPMCYGCGQLKPGKNDTSARYNQHAVILRSLQERFYAINKE